MKKIPIIERELLDDGEPIVKANPLPDEEFIDTEDPAIEERPQVNLISPAGNSFPLILRDTLDEEGKVSPRFHSNPAFLSEFTEGEWIVPKHCANHKSRF